MAETAKLAERARIARELHDGVSQTLYAITLAAAKARSLCEQNRSDEVQIVIDGLLQLANAGQSELRAILGSVRPDWATSVGLANALASLATAVRAGSSLDIRLFVANEPDVSSEAKEELFMISREALNNALRHARATRVDIVLEVDTHEVVLLVVDNGRGFDRERLGPGHFGLRSMGERAQVAGGTLDVDSADGVGTRVRVRLPRDRQCDVGIRRRCRW